MPRLVEQYNGILQIARDETATNRLHVLKKEVNLVRAKELTELCTNTLHVSYLHSCTRI